MNMYSVDLPAQARPTGPNTLVGASSLAHATAIGMPQLGPALAQLAPRLSPQSSSGGGLGRAEVFDSLRKQILVVFSSSLSSAIRTYDKNCEIDSNFHLRSLICRGTRTLPHCTRRPGIQHPVAGPPRPHVGGPVLRYETGGLPGSQHQQAGLGTTDVGSPATAHQRTTRPLGAVNVTDAGRADAAAEPTIALTARLLTSAQHRWRGQWQQPRGRARR